MSLQLTSATQPGNDDRTNARPLHYNILLIVFAAGSHFSGERIGGTVDDDEKAVTAAMMTVFNMVQTNCFALTN